MRKFTGPDGIEWAVEARLPSHSSVMLVFLHPERGTARLDRYAWYNWGGSEARSVTARLDLAAVLDSLDDASLGRLFRRSMPVSPAGNPLNRRAAPRP